MKVDLRALAQASKVVLGAMPRKMNGASFGLIVQGENGALEITGGYGTKIDGRFASVSLPADGGPVEPVYVSQADLELIGRLVPLGESAEVTSDGVSVGETFVGWNKWLNAPSFPVPQAVRWEKSYPYRELTDRIAHLAAHALVDEHYVLRGIAIDGKGMAAMDRSRLLFVPDPSDLPRKTTIVVPALALKDALKAPKELRPDDVLLWADEEYLFGEWDAPAGRVSFGIKLIPDEFPAYARNFRNRSDKGGVTAQVRVTRELMSTLRSHGALDVKDKKLSSPALTMVRFERGMPLRVQTMGSSARQMAASWVPASRVSSDGYGVYQTRFLLDALSAFPVGTLLRVRLELGDYPLHLIAPSGQRAAIMPVRISGSVAESFGLPPGGADDASESA